MKIGETGWRAKSLSYGRCNKSPIIDHSLRDKLTLLSEKSKILRRLKLIELKCH